MNTRQITVRVDESEWINGCSLQLGVSPVVEVLLPLGSEMLGQSSVVSSLYRALLCDTALNHAQLLLAPKKSPATIGEWRREQGSEAWRFLVTNQHVGNGGLSVAQLRIGDSKVVR